MQSSPRPSFTRSSEKMVTINQHESLAPARTKPWPLRPHLRGGNTGVPPYARGDMVPDPQWMPEPEDSTKPCICCGFFPYAYITNGQV